MNRDILKVNWPNGREKNRKFKDIRKFFDITKKDEELIIDDQTWTDLDMDSVFCKVDKTYSSVGEAVLYKMLRLPMKDKYKLKERNEKIEYLRNNEEVREKIQMEYFNLNKDRKYSTINLLTNGVKPSLFKYILYTFLGKIAPIMIIAIVWLYGINHLIYFLFLSFINMYINMKERQINSVESVGYLGNMIIAGKNICRVKNDGIQDNQNEIKKLTVKLKKISGASSTIGKIQSSHAILDVICVLFLLEECAYYKIAKDINENRDDLKKLYNALGEVEALISIAAYKETLKYSEEPKFIEKIKLEVVDAVHPLIEEPVSNSLNIDGKGIVLTGTNMSGKSTFLRAIGINILFAETFYFTLCKKYEGTFFNIVSSISPTDDVLKGTSYYMAEAKAVLRIIKALEKEEAVFCIIDEIFRGTNPSERIAASSEILKYIQKRNSISIVATHDRELTDILKETHEFYYFSETVDEKKGLIFDYKIKSGVSPTKNAIRLLSFIGYPEEIIRAAYRRVDELDDKYL